MMLDCGHLPSWKLGHAYSPAGTVTSDDASWVCTCGEHYRSHGIGTGYTTRDGRTMCYPCADSAQAVDIETLPAVVAYAEPWTHPEYVTTWTGGRLARVVRVSTWRGWVHGWHRSHMIAVRVRTPGGRVLAGRYNEDTGNAVALRPVKPRPGELPTTAATEA